MLVLIESPFAGYVERNIAYARACVRDSLLKGEYPWCSHLFYTQEGILNDNIPEERQMGIDVGLEWGAKSDKTIVYDDLGISRGMKYGIQNAEKAGRPIEYRKLPENILNSIMEKYPDTTETSKI